MPPPSASPAIRSRRTTISCSPATCHRSVTRDGGAGRRGRHLRFDSAPPSRVPPSAAARVGRSLTRVQRRRIEAETVPPLPCTDVSGHAPLDQNLQRVEPEAGLVELAAELRPPSAGRVERRVLDAVNVGGELDPLLVERAHALAGEVGDREAELEDRVLAGPRPERAGPGGEPAHVVAGQDDHGKGDPGLRLELLDEGTAQGGLLVEQDRLQAELHEEARDLLLHLPVPAVHDEHFAVRSRLRTGARQIRLEDARAEPELLRHRLELAEIRLHVLALIRYARRVAETHARVDGPQVLVELVRHEEKPEQLARAVLPGAVGVVCLVVPADLETPHQLPAPADVIEQEPRAASVSGELGAKRRAWKLGHGTSPERRRLWRAWGDPCLRRAKAMRVRRGGSPAPLGAAGCRAAVPEGSHGVKERPRRTSLCARERQSPSKPAIF